LFFCWKKCPKDLKRIHFKGMVVSPTVADDFFDVLSGRDVLLALASDIVPTMTANALSSLFRVTKKEKALDHLLSRIHKLAVKEHKVELEKIVKKSPMIGGKNDVTRLFFLGRLSCIHEMEHDYLSEAFPKKCACLFEPDLKRAVDHGMSELMSVVSVAPALQQTAKRGKRQPLNLSRSRCFSDMWFCIISVAS
jgi:hypothetical protein